MQQYNNNNGAQFARGGFGGRGRGGFGRGGGSGFRGGFGGGLAVRPVACFSCGRQTFLASRGCSSCGRPGNAIGGQVFGAGPVVRSGPAGPAPRQACGVCRVGKVCPHVAVGGRSWAGQVPANVSVVRQGGQSNDVGAETRRFKSGLQKMWAGAKYSLKDDTDPAVKEKNQWLKFQCYLVDSLLATALDGTAKAEVTEVEVSLCSNTLSGDGIVCVALAGMPADKSLGLDSIREIAGARRFRLSDLRGDVVRVVFKITEDLSGVIKPRGEVSKAPRVVIRVIATKDCIEESVSTLTYKVKVTAVVGRGATQLA